MLLIAALVLWLGGITLTASAQTAIVNFDVIDVRSGPGTSYDVIGTLNNNTSVNILEHNHGWIKISSDSMNGWVTDSLTNPSPSLNQIPPIPLYINDKQSFDIDTITVNGYTLVPLGPILDNLEADVTIDSSSQTLTASKSGSTVTLTIGSLTATVNDQEQNLDVPAQIVNGRTFVPLRFLAEALGCKTTWDGESRKINVKVPLDTTGDTMSKSGGAKNITTLAVSISANDVNIRSGPSIGSAVVGLAPGGTRLAYLGEKDGWCQVMYHGQSAWVAGWLVTQPATAELSSELEPMLLPVPSTHYGFVLQMKPYAEMTSKGTGLPVNFLLAQWAEESGFGTSALAKYYNNFGGVKDPNTGGFKKYQTAEEFALDVTRIYTQNSNYRKLLADARAGASIQTLINDLSTCHYATSSTYGQKIRNVYLPEVDAALANMK